MNRPANPALARAVTAALKGDKASGAKAFAAQAAARHRSR